MNIVSYQDLLEVPHVRPDEKPYLFQIVANKTNGLDVDK